MVPLHKCVADFKLMGAGEARLRSPQTRSMLLDLLRGKSLCLGAESAIRRLEALAQLQAMLPLAESQQFARVICIIIGMP